MEKPMINLVIAGHVDHGKSTLVGRLFEDLNLVSKAEKDKAERDAKDLGKETFRYAFVMDTSLEERRRGLTIELGFKAFETQNRRFNIIDAPGHSDFVKNMITGTAEADAGVLVVDAQDTLEKIMPQTKEHAILMLTLGVDQLLVFINKMDLVSYSKDAFETVKSKLKEFLSSLGFSKLENIMYIPGSAFHGENVSVSSSKMDWYTGPTFLEALDTLQEPPRPVDRPFRMPVLRTFTSRGMGKIIVAGKVESGEVKEGDTIQVVPYGGTGKILSIEWQHKRLPAAEPGFDVGLALSGAVNKREIKKGYMVCKAGELSQMADQFKARVMAWNRYLGVGYCPLIHCHQAVVPVQVMKVKSTFDISTGEVLSGDVEGVQPGQGGIVWIKPLKPLVIEKASEFPRLSRFALRDGVTTVAAGVCVDIIPKKEEKKK
ncbi:MAG: GTP-binding protein [Theionarchaea archaeon]|nr:GTP-binding protein [Theionarchaea archaeon]MBU7039125.1 GTP-binding protein [Theionarchaea archaeon]